MWVQQLYQNKSSPEINLLGLIPARRTMGQGGSFFRIGSKYIIFEIAKRGNSGLGDSIRMCSMRFRGWRTAAGGATERGNTCPVASSTQTNVIPPPRNPPKSLLLALQMQPWWLCWLACAAGQNSVSAAQSRTVLLHKCCHFKSTLRSWPARRCQGLVNKSPLPYWCSEPVCGLLRWKRMTVVQSAV